MVSSSFPSKTQFGTFWLYLEQQQDTKGESIVWKHTKHHKIFFFSSSNLVFVPNWTLKHCTQITYENALILLFCLHLHGKTFPSQTA